MASSDGVPHTFPAAVIGGFGLPSRGRPQRLRCNYLAVRRVDKPNIIISPVSAENISTVPDEYAFDTPPQGMHRNMIDSIWDTYESGLPAAIGRLERGNPAPTDWRTVLRHVHAQGVRSRDYRNRAGAYLLAEHGVANPTKDQLQAERLVTYLNTPDVIARCRFAIVRRPIDGPKLIANDKGYAMPIQDREFGVKCLVFPLSPYMAVLAVVDAAKAGDDYTAGPMEDLTLTPAAVDVINEASWRLGGIDCIFGHPDEGAYLRQLDRERVLMFPTLGPYRGTCDLGLADWAVVGKRATSITVQDWKGI